MQLTHTEQATDPAEFEKLVARLSFEPWYIPLRRHSKKPDIPQGGSTKNIQYRLTTEHVRNRLRRGLNAGIMAQGHDLVFFDLDHPSQYEYMANTFTVRTRNGRLHKYFVNGGDVQNADGKGRYAGCGEVRASWKYVAVPGSYVPPDHDNNGDGTGLYHVSNDRSFATLYNADLPSEFQATPTPPPTVTDSVFDEKQLSDARRGNHKLDALLTHQQPPEYKYPSQSEADLAAMTLLKSYSFTQLQVFQILRKYRKRPKLSRDDYLKLTWAKAGKVTPRSPIPADPTSFFTVKENGKLGSFIPKWLGDYILKENRFAAVDDRQPILHYNPATGIWEPNGKAFLRQRVNQILGDHARRRHSEEVEHYIRYENLIDTNQLNHDTQRLVVANGVLNLSTRELTPFNPALYATIRLPVTYDADAICPACITFFGEVTPGEVETMQEWFGFHLLRERPAHRMMMFIGEGRNGKGVTCKLLEHLIGPDNAAHCTIYEITGTRFAIVDLRDKLANIASDISADEIKRTGMLKSLSGGDTVRVEGKFKAGENLDNYAKFTFCCNQLPPTPDRTLAFFERWLMISFPNIFIGDNCDPTIIKKLTTQPELSGLLNWALDGLDRLATQNWIFTHTHTAAENERLWDAMSDTVQAFITARIEHTENDHDELGKKALYEIYFTYCRDHQLTPLKHGRFVNRFEILLGVRESRPAKGDGRHRVWRGVTLRAGGLKSTKDNGDTPKTADRTQVAKPTTQQKLETLPPPKPHKYPTIPPHISKATICKINIKREDKDWDSGILSVPPIRRCGTCVFRETTECKERKNGPVSLMRVGYEWHRERPDVDNPLRVG